MKEAMAIARLVYHRGAVGLLIGAAVFLSTPSVPSWAQEVTSKIYRYRERVATGYYEGYEVSPRRARAILETPGVKRDRFSLGASAAKVRIRSHLPDSHQGLKFYYRNTCIECHAEQARNLHSMRAGITCRQCHGPEPIAAIDHYYSAMNTIRRHAYVCSKCHEGATASFSGFYVHEPPSTALSTRESFPLLFYTSWGMLVLLLGTLAFFVPHSFMVGFRELLDKMKEPESSVAKLVNAASHHIMGGIRKVFEKKKVPGHEVDDAA